MGLVDLSILGRGSVVDLAGAAIGRSLGFSSVTLGMGVAMALEPLASQALGAKEPERAWESLVAALRGVALVWLPTFAAAIAVTFALEPFGVEHEVVLRGRAFLYGQSGGLFLTGVFMALKTFLQAHGRTRPALVAALVANLTNVVVCTLLVRGDEGLRAFGLPALGLQPRGALGAGLAFSLANLVLVAIAFRAAWSLRPSAAARAASVAPVRVSGVLKLGVPIGLQVLAEMGVFTVVALFIGKLGANVVGAHQVALSLASFTYMGALGVSGATAVRVGRAIGEARSPRRAGLLGIALGCCVMCIGALAFGLVPRALARLFTEDGEVIALGVELLGIAAVFQLFDGVQAVASGALRGAGDVRFVFVANLISYWVLGFPVGLLLGFPMGWGARGLWWGLTFGLVCTSLILARRFYVLSGKPIARV